MYTTNLLFVSYFDDQIDLEGITGDTIFSDPQEFEIPDIDIPVLDSSEFVKRDHSLIADLNKTVSMLKRHKTPYYNEYDSWLFQTGFGLIPARYAIHVASVAGFLAFVAIIILLVHHHKLGALAQAMSLFRVVQQVKAEDGGNSMMELPFTLTLSNVISLTAVFGAITFFLLKQCYKVYKNRHGHQSIFRYWDTEPVQPVTDMCLELSSGKHRVLLNMSPIHSVSTHLKFIQTGPMPEMYLTPGLFSSHLVIKWHDTKVFHTLHEDFTELDNVIFVPWYLKFTTDYILNAKFSVRIMYGSCGYYEKFYVGNAGDVEADEPEENQVQIPKS